MPARPSASRREELLDGVMAIVSERGFADVKMAEMAAELHCSISTLYKIAPNKDSLVAMAITRWGELTIACADARAQECIASSDKARAFFLCVAERLSPLSHEFMRDTQRYESSRTAYGRACERAVGRLAEFLDGARAAGEIRTANTRFLAHILRQLTLLLRDEEVLQSCGLTAELAMIEIDAFMWDGVRKA